MAILGFGSVIPEPVFREDTRYESLRRVIGAVNQTLSAGRASGNDRLARFGPRITVMGTPRFLARGSMYQR